MPPHTIYSTLSRSLALSAAFPQMQACTRAFTHSRPVHFSIDLQIYFGERKKERKPRLGSSRSGQRVSPFFYSKNATSVDIFFRLFFCSNPAVGMAKALVTTDCSLRSMNARSLARRTSSPLSNSSLSFRIPRLAEAFVCAIRRETQIKMNQDSFGLATEIL